MIVEATGKVMQVLSKIEGVSANAPVTSTDRYVSSTKRSYRNSNNMVYGNKKQIIQASLFAS
jgi:hypothetical protein